MKSDIHPQWYPAATVSCACGNTFTVGMTKSDIKVEICYNCHPFYTGEMKFIDALGRVERFQAKVQAAKATSAVLADKKKKKKARDEARANAPKSLKEMLMGLN